MEDPKVSANQNTKNQTDHDELDDLLFDMTAPNTRASTSKAKGGHPQTPSGVYRNEDGQSKDTWFREEEVMRRKLEKVAVNQLKSRIAQQNRAAGTGK